jgi:hypothetical protein
MTDDSQPVSEEYRHLGLTTPSIREVIRSKEEIGQLNEQLTDLFVQRQKDLLGREKNGPVLEPLDFSYENLRLIAKYYSVGWNYYSSFIANFEFWSVVANTYATVSNDNENEHAEPPRGLPSS